MWPVINSSHLKGSNYSIKTGKNTVAAHLRAAALIETQHFVSKGHGT